MLIESRRAMCWAVSLLLLGAGAGLASPQDGPPPGSTEPPVEASATERDRAAVPEIRSDVSLPDGLTAFLEARLLEAGGDYREALSRYAEALEENPSSTEVRVHYASLLNEMGLPDTALSVLEGGEDLDWFALRVRALALTQLTGHRAELLQEAEQALRAALDERPEDTSLQLPLAQVLHRQGRLEEAETLVSELRAKRDGHQRLVAYHASLLQGLGRLDEAAELYARCAEGRGPFAQPCQESLVDLLVEMDRPAEAAEIMLGWLTDEDLDDLLQAARLLSAGGRPEQGLTVVRRVLAIEPDSRQARLYEALLLSALDRHDEAVQRLRTLLREEPGDVDLQLSLAWSEMRLGRLDEARVLLQQVWESVREQPTSARAVHACLEAARVELAAGHPLRSREWLDRVGDVDKGGVELVRLLATTYRGAGQWHEGVAAMLRLQPRVAGQARVEAVAFEAECRLQLGEAGRALRMLRPFLDSDEREEFLAAIQVLQAAERWRDLEREVAAALERLPASRDLRFARAAALERLGRPSEAEQVFSELVEDDARDAASANYLGYMWADAGVRLEEALELISRAVTLEPNNPAYIDSLGWVHFRLGNLEEAARWLRRAARSAATDGTVLAHLGEVLVALGDEEEARHHLSRALEIGCDRPQHVRGLLDGLE